MEEARQKFAAMMAPEGASGRDSPRVKTSPEPRDHTATATTTSKVVLPKVFAPAEKGLPGNGTTHDVAHAAFWASITTGDVGNLPRKALPFKPKILARDVQYGTLQFLAMAELNQAWAVRDVKRDGLELAAGRVTKKQLDTTIQMIKHLIDFKVFPSADDCSEESKTTALMFAAKAGKTDLCLALLDLGADPTMLNTGSKQAWQLAEAAGHEDLARTLKAAMSAANKDRRVSRGPGTQSPQPPVSPPAAVVAPVQPSDHRMARAQKEMVKLY